ncbi:HAD-IIA family hydrolase [Pseudooceanicola spongiae]|uniref:HAD hydrolase-like protein n=1 Tax=Pseudooceanicola spongiae TaxID=2613965 RepID=A0A7L9WJG0_9RHOB|nr:HAD family hydrolase [Pseudooceanicola spongiae]QOL80515.1 HAD hydrolase-like protein [Pseudooceanicola spongiae]
MHLDAYDGFLCDLDGCLISGTTVLPGAKALLDYAGDRLIILSNNSTDTPATLSARLKQLGLSAPPERIVLAGTAALDHLAQIGGVRLRLYASADLRAYAQPLGLSLDSAEPTHVLLTRDETFGYSDLRDVIALLARGAELFVANPDESHPGPDGMPVPETGSLLAAVLSVLPDLRYTVIGKPEAGLYHAALVRLSGDPRRVLAIGDNPKTDAAGAARLGFDCALVGADHGEWTDLDHFLAAGRADKRHAQH